MISSLPILSSLRDDHHTCPSASIHNGGATRPLPQEATQRTVPQMAAAAVVASCHRRLPPPPGLTRTRTGRRRHQRRQQWERMRSKCSSSTLTRSGGQEVCPREMSSAEFLQVAGGVRRRFPHLQEFFAIEGGERLRLPHLRELQVQKKMLMLCDKPVATYNIDEQNEAHSKALTNEAIKAVVSLAKVRKMHDELRMNWLQCKKIRNGAMEIGTRPREPDKGREGPEAAGDRAKREVRPRRPKSDCQHHGFAGKCAMPPGASQHRQH